METMGDMHQSDPISIHLRIRFFLGDVRDKSRLERAFNEVDVLVHTLLLSKYLQQNTTRQNLSKQTS